MGVEPPRTKILLSAGALNWHRIEKRDRFFYISAVLRGKWLRSQCQMGDCAVFHSRTFKKSIRCF